MHRLEHAAGNTIGLGLFLRVSAMKRKTIIILVLIAIPISFVGYSLIMSLTVGVLSISTIKGTYSQGETITFFVRNNGFGSLEFGDMGLGFRIKNLDTGKYVGLDRGYPQMVHYMGPLALETTSWDQTELARSNDNPFEHRQVIPGNYVASVNGWDGSKSVLAEVKFRIS